MDAQMVGRYGQLGIHFVQPAGRRRIIKVPALLNLARPRRDVRDGQMGAVVAHDAVRAAPSDNRNESSSSVTPTML